MVGVTQKEHRGFSLPQMPLESYGWLKSIEPEDLTNGIVVFFWVSSLALLQFVFFYCLFTQPTSLQSPKAHYSLVILNEGLVCSSFTVWSTARVIILVKANPKCVATASHGMRSTASLFNSHTLKECQHGAAIFLGFLWKEEILAPTWKPPPKWNESMEKAELWLDWLWSLSVCLLQNGNFTRKCLTVQVKISCTVSLGD